MSKKNIIISSIIVTVTIIAIVGFVIFRDAKFELDDNMYDSGQIIETDISNVEAMITEHKSFALFVSQPGCRTADDLREIIQEFTSMHHLTVYEVDYSGLRESNLVPGLKFYPSLVVFRRGKPVDFLEADNGEDSSAYTSLDGFSTWFTDYAIMKD